MNSNPLKFRVDIQALRAVAVVSVVAAHFWPGLFPGGFTGVDVFFVISGFLITTQIVNEVTRTGRLNFTDFWARRIRRIMPASLVVITAVVIAVMWIGSSDQIGMLWRHVAASSLSAENLLLAWDAVDYDNREDAVSPLQHFWSLAVEEQFYLVWPLLVGLVVAASALFRGTGVSIRFALTATIIVVSLVSFAYAVTLDSSDPATYYNPLSRVWELGVGAALAASGATLSRWSRPQARRALGVVAWVVVIGVSVVPHLLRSTPGFGVLASVIATGVIIALAQPPSESSNRAVRWGVTSLVWVGDRSYSIYLWHWPILILAPYVTGAQIGLLEKALILLAVVALSMASYRFVEQPFRTSTSPIVRKKIILFPLATVATAAVIIGTLVVVNIAQSRTGDVRPEAVPAPVGNPSADSVSTEYPLVSEFCQGAGSAVFECPPNVEVTFGEQSLPKDPPTTTTCTSVGGGAYDECILGNPNATYAIALVGDSHAKALWAGFDYLGKQIDAKVYAFVQPGCAFGLSDKPLCVARNAMVRDRLIAGEFDFAFLAQSVQRQGGLEEQFFLDKFGVPYRELLGAQVPFVVLKDNPRLGDEELDCLRFKTRNAYECSITRDEAFRYRDYAFDVATELSVPTVDLSDIYCGPETCPLAMGGVRVYRDRGHITTVFGESLGPFIYNELTELGFLAVSGKAE